MGGDESSYIPQYVVLIRERCKGYELQTTVQSEGITTCMIGTDGEHV